MTFQDILDRLDYLWNGLVLFRIHETRVTAGLAILAALALALSWIVSWAVRRFLRRRVLPRFSLEPPVREFALRLVHYVLLAAGLVAGLSLLRIPLGFVQRLWSEVPLFTIQDARITLSTVVVAVLAVFLSVLASKWARHLLQQNFLPRFHLDRGLEYALLRFVHYCILVVGVYVGLVTMNIPLGALVGFFTLLGVGIGFGLQNLSSNFISGVILLFERPIKVGDRITVDDVWGDVQKINLRTTIVNTVDNVSIIIPNSKLLENNLINWSYGDERIRVRVPVGVAYGSDVDLVTELLTRAARENETVLEEPGPKVWFREFGDSSLNFELLCWLPESTIKPRIVNELNRAIDRLFREHEVEIPFPQRDLHIRSDATRERAAKPATP